MAITALGWQYRPMARDLLEELAARAAKTAHEEGADVAIVGDEAAALLLRELLRRHGRVLLSWRDREQGTERTIALRR